MLLSFKMADPLSNVWFMVGLFLKKEMDDVVRIERAFRKSDFSSGRLPGLLNPNASQYAWDTIYLCADARRFIIQGLAEVKKLKLRRESEFSLRKDLRLSSVI